MSMGSDFNSVITTWWLFLFYSEGVHRNTVAYANTAILSFLRDRTR